MPIEKEVDRTRQLTVLTVIGEVSYVEMRRTIEWFWEMEPLTLNVLWDYRRASLKHWTREDHEQLVRVGLKYRHRHAERAGGKTAIIAAADLEFGINRASATMTQLEGYPFRSKTFRTAEEAEAWLAKSD